MTDALRETCPTCECLLLTGPLQACPSCMIGPVAGTANGRVGRFDLGHVLGRGGMAVVYEAFSEDFDELLAIKILPEDWARDPAFVERFTRETKALSRLDHPNIVRQVASGSDEGVPYSVMEYVEGGTLAQRLKDGPLDPPIAVDFALQVCRALAHAHAHHTTHRDIKPSNILLTPEGRVKIADFGLARVLEDGGEESFSLTLSGSRLGTPYYMAPEQYRDTRSAGPRADLYSVGVVLYEMLTGCVPSGNFPLPSATRPDIPADIDRIIQRALQTDPENRFASAEQMEHALLAVSWNRRRRRRVVCGALGAVTILTATMLALIPEPARIGGGMIPLGPTASDPGGSDSWISPHPVTVAEWNALMPEWKGLRPGPPSGVVLNVNWPEAQEYCRRRSAADHLAKTIPASHAYRLPTAAEWLSYRKSSGRHEGLPDSGEPLAEHCEDGDRTTERPDQPFGPAALITRRSIAASPPHGVTDVLLSERETPEGVPLGFRLTLAHRRDDRPGDPRLDLTLARIEGVDSPRTGASEVRNALGMEFVGFDPGTVQRTLTDARLHVDFHSGPQATLTRGFWMAKSEVNREQFARIVGTNPSRNQVKGDGDRYPVDSVTWMEADFFCRRLTKLERAAGLLPQDMEYTLPSIDQWRLACLAAFEGGKPAPHAYEDDRVVARLRRPAGLGPPDRAGLHDLFGNVSEWLGSSAQAAEWEDAGKDPKPLTIAYQVPRAAAGGGSGWNFLKFDGTVTFRDPQESAEHLGFRPVLVSSRIHPEPTPVDGFAAASGPLTLQARQAGLLGHNLHITQRWNIVDTWVNENDSAYWLINDLPAGRYKITASYHSPCSLLPFGVWIGDQQLEARTPAGGTPGTRFEQMVGVVSLPAVSATTLTVRIQPLEPPPYHFAHLHSLRLDPE